MSSKFNLVTVQTESQWKEYHRIRREELFDNSPTYQEDHEDEFKAKKFHIIGAPGSGKTYLAKKLSEISNAPLLELDQIHWNNDAEDYNTKAPEHVRDAKLKEFISGEGWIVEGIYYKWTDISFAKADLIIIIFPSSFTRNFRVIKRYILAKFGKGSSNENSLKDLYALIRWGNTYLHDKLPKIDEITAKYKDKRVYINSADDFLKVLK
tara:strand:- start:40642 stop:41268 length:627 start_codon:yes stop_codon:yes gene_type:complete